MWFEGFTENASKIFQSLPEEKISIAEDRVLSVFLTSRAGHDPLEIIEAIENDPQATVDELITAASYHSSHSFAQKSLQLLDRAIPLVSGVDAGIMALPESFDFNGEVWRGMEYVFDDLEKRSVPGNEVHWLSLCTEARSVMSEVRSFSEARKKPDVR